MPKKYLPKIDFQKVKLATIPQPQNKRKEKEMKKMLLTWWREMGKHQAFVTTVCLALFYVSFLMNNIYGDEKALPGIIAFSLTTILIFFSGLFCRNTSYLFLVIGCNAMISIIMANCSLIFASQAEIFFTSYGLALISLAVHWAFFSEKENEWLSSKKILVSISSLAQSAVIFTPIWLSVK